MFSFLRYHTVSPVGSLGSFTSSSFPEHPPLLHPLLVLSCQRLAPIIVLTVWLGVSVNHDPLFDLCGRPIMNIDGRLWFGGSGEPWWASAKHTGCGQYGGSAGTILLSQRDQLPRVNAGASARGAA
jgi:hypothetical protein